MFTASWTVHKGSYTEGSYPKNVAIARIFLIYFRRSIVYYTRSAIFSLRTSRLKFARIYRECHESPNVALTIFIFLKRSLLKFVVIGLFVRTLVGQKTHPHRNENLTPFYRGHEFRGPRNRLDSDRQEEFVEESKRRVTEN